MGWAIPKDSSCSQFQQNLEVMHEQLIPAFPRAKDRIGGEHRGLEEDYPTHIPQSENQCTPEHFSNDPLHGVESCHNHFVYDKSVREDSIVSEVKCTLTQWLSENFWLYTINKHTIMHFPNDKSIVQLSFCSFLLIFFCFMIFFIIMHLRSYSVRSCVRERVLDDDFVGRVYGGSVLWSIGIWNLLWHVSTPTSWANELSGSQKLFAW